MNRQAWVAAVPLLLLLLARSQHALGAAQSDKVQQLREWALLSKDNAGQPFVVLDKQQARLWLFDAQGQALGDTPVLLGFAKGDASVPGIGKRPIKDIRPHERTTPAGRFFAEAGRNASGEDIFWVDYDAAVSMHRVRALVPAERRLQRLATPAPSDNRISYGCINVPVGFYDEKLRPTLIGRKGVVYVLPETMPLQKLFTSITSVVAAVP